MPATEKVNTRNFSTIDSKLNENPSKLFYEMAAALGEVLSVYKDTANSLEQVGLVLSTDEGVYSEIAKIENLLNQVDAFSLDTTFADHRRLHNDPRNYRN